MSTQPVLPFRIRLRGLPLASCGAHTHLEAGLQRGTAIVQSQPPAGDALEFSGELRMKDISTEARRNAPVLKAPLGGVTWAHIDALCQDRTATLVATVAGRDRHGGPACATVPLLDGGWQVEHRTTSA